ncbi:MAG: hypothetical protein ACRDKA_08830 [Actinomycetota bacterium]
MHEEVPTLLIGLLVGIAIGLLLGPVLRSWLTWREYFNASREARLQEEVLRRMAASPPPGDGPAGGSLGPAQRR